MCKIICDQCIPQNKNQNWKQHHQIQPIDNDKITSLMCTSARITLHTWAPDEIGSSRPFHSAFAAACFAPWTCRWSGRVYVGAPNNSTICSIATWQSCVTLRALCAIAVELGDPVRYQFTNYVELGDILCSRHTWHRSNFARRLNLSSKTIQFPIKLQFRARGPSGCSLGYNLYPFDCI